MSAFHLLRPAWLLALIPLALLLWLLWRRKLAASGWRSVCDPALLPHLLADDDGIARRGPLALLGLGGLLAILALAGPAWERQPQPVFREQSPLVLALDLSRSMDATDITPSRLTRARHKLLDILAQRREGQTALLAYAAQPYVVTPLTEDTTTISAQANSLETELMPAQGSRPDLAVTKAVELLRQGGHVQGDILLLTDGLGDTPAEAVLAAREERTYRISVLAIGTEDGAPIPLPRGGFLKNAAGEIVLPRLETAPLQTLAQQGGGQFASLSLDDRDIRTLLAPLASRQLDAQTEQTDVTSDQWREEGPWLLLCLLPLAALAFRRGYLMIAALLLLPPPPAQAMEWQDLWLTPDQQATRALDGGDPKAAADRFEDPTWKGAAQYRAGEYEQAAETLDGLQDADALYNKGNALAKNGKLQEAIQAYEQSLALQPNNADAKHNKELVEQALQQQQSQQQDQNDGQDGEQQQQDGDKSESKNQGEQQQEQDQNGQPEPQENEQARQTSANGDKSNEKPGEQEQEPPPEQTSGEEKPQPQASGDEEQQEAQPAPSPDDSEEPPPQMDPVTEQWLRRIPDDPGGLLRRKFLYQYQRQKQSTKESQPW